MYSKTEILKNNVEAYSRLLSSFKAIRKDIKEVLDSCEALKQPYPDTYQFRDILNKHTVDDQQFYWNNDTFELTGATYFNVHENRTLQIRRTYAMTKDVQDDSYSVEDVQRMINSVIKLRKDKEEIDRQIQRMTEDYMDIFPMIRTAVEIGRI